MSDEEATVFLWIIGAFVGLMAILFGLYLLGDSVSYSSSGKGGNTDPDNPWLQL